ncbi:MAG: glycosyltransferase family 2 protein [Marivibrio sp.]|uniref:glycosyltransferase family 2 protein n=1 Tax=Marivibrio sp. TaxID=2039719 RepID=UPI0032EDE9A6
MSEGATDRGASRDGVSVVVRVHNRRDTVAAALDSILAQTSPPARILAVDDASDDGSADFIEQTYGDAVTLVRRAARGGPGAAANSGLEAVETPFVAFLDSDDVWHPLFLERMTLALGAAPEASLVYCDFRRRFARYGLDAPGLCSVPSVLDEDVRTPILSLSLILARTRALRRMGGFREDVRIGEDLDMALRLAAERPDALAHLSLSLATYRVGADNITHDHERLLKDYARVLDDLLELPRFSERRERRAEMLRRRIIGGLKRRAVARWLAAEPTRPASLIVVAGPGGEEAVRRSLDSAAAQRSPPIDAVVVHPADAVVPSASRAELPFPVRDYARAPGVGLASALQHAAAACIGEIVLFLIAGDRLTGDALDRHRRAFSASASPVHLSYGGLPDRPTPPPLGRAPARAALQAAKHAIPGRLSTIAVSRRVLTGLPSLPDGADGTAWLAVTARVLAEDGLAVRLTGPVLAEAGSLQPVETPAVAALFDALCDGAAGRVLRGLADAAADDAAAGRTAFEGAYDGPAAFDPIW